MSTTSSSRGRKQWIVKFTTPIQHEDIHVQYTQYIKNSCRFCYTHCYTHINPKTDRDDKVIITTIFVVFPKPYSQFKLLNSPISLSKYCTDIDCESPNGTAINICTSLIKQQPPLPDGGLEYTIGQITNPGGLPPAIQKFKMFLEQRNIPQQTTDDSLESSDSD